MAMAVDFWRNEQSLNIFRTKPCQRLARDGVCGWRSQCQFSHCLEWPRRQIKRCNYSPELCPDIRVIENSEGGSERIENNCSAGVRCPWAHSKEEVLFHPHIFKTSLCEEHTNNSGNGQKSRSAKKNRCHRYYCPFAHGAEELQNSPMPAEQRERCLRAMEVFPSDVCCVVCTRHWINPQVTEKACQEPGCLGFDVPGPLGGYGSMMSPGKGPLAMGPHAFDVLSTVPNAMQHPGLVQKPPKELSSLFSGEPLTSLRSNLTSDSPAYIDLAGMGMGTVGQRQMNTTPPSNNNKGPTTPTSAQGRDLLGEYFFAML